MSECLPFKYFKTSPEIIRLAIMMEVRFPLSLRNFGDMLYEWGIDISHETIRFWWNRWGPNFASEIRRRRVEQLRSFSRRQWHADEIFVKINGEWHYLWRAVDHEGEVLESIVTKPGNKRAALKMPRGLMLRYGPPSVLVTDRFLSYKAALRDLGCADLQALGSLAQQSVESSHLPIQRRERAMQRFQRVRSLQKFISLHASILHHFNQDLRPSCLRLR